jgi:hypothetical protein
MQFSSWPGRSSTLCAAPAASQLLNSVVGQPLTAGRDRPIHTRCMWQNNLDLLDFSGTKQRQARH